MEILSIFLPLLIALPFLIPIVWYYWKKEQNSNEEDYKPKTPLINPELNKKTETRSPNTPAIPTPHKPQSTPQIPRTEQNLENTILKYEELIKDFKYEKYQLEKHEFVFLIEDSVIVFIGIDNCKSFEWLSKRHVLIEELTENKIFKFVASHFHYIFKSHMSDLRVVRFYGLEDKNELKSKNATKFFYVNEKLPQLHLLDRLNSWDGELYHFVVVELYDSKGSVYNIGISTMQDVEKFAHNYCRDIENYRKKKYPKNFINNDAFYDKLEYMYNNFVSSGKDLKFWSLRGNLRYFYITKHLKKFNFAKETQDIYQAISSGEYDGIEWFEYGRFDGKWKSELLVFEHCKKLFGEKDVLYQYSPEFLGQMSYDVFISSQNIAIEYQGKQHFEPVEFFGGQEHFEQQVKRDKLKKKLSKENGVNLIYINYNEIISDELILEKIKKSQKRG